MVHGIDNFQNINDKIEMKGSYRIEDEEKWTI